MKLHTWIGLSILLAGQAALRLGSPLVATWLTPIMWTGYILALDGVNFRLRGQSWLTTGRREFPLLALLSAGVWLIFEAYNLYLVNWIYRGLPQNDWIRNFGYLWSFATIMPGVFQTADLVQGLLERAGLNSPAARPPALGPSWAWAAAGGAMVVVPLLLPRLPAAHLFGAVWIGHFLLLDPLNARLGLPSLRAELAQGRWQRTAGLLLGGLLCGFLWETWNQQAVRAGGAYWVYTVPTALRIFGWHFGQMPVLGLLGFPPFALELYAFYQLLRGLLGGKRIFDPLPASRA